MRRLTQASIKSELAEIEDEVSRLLADGFKITRVRHEQEAVPGYDDVNCSITFEVELRKGNRDGEEVKE